MLTNSILYLEMLILFTQKTILCRRAQYALAVKSEAPKLEFSLLPRDASSSEDQSGFILSSCWPCLLFNVKVILSCAAETTVSAQLSAPLYAPLGSNRLHCPQLCWEQFLFLILFFFLAGIPLYLAALFLLCAP